MRNSRTYSPLHAFSSSSSPLWITNAPQEKQRGRCCQKMGKRDKLGEGKRTERCFRSTSISEWKRDERGKEIRRGERNEWEKGERALFSLPLPHPARWRGGPKREPRLIGSFGLEKWISPPQKTCFPPNQMTNEPIDLLFTIQGAQCPLSAHDGPHNGRVSKVYRRRSPLNWQLSGLQNAHNSTVCATLLLCQALRRCF